MMADDKELSEEELWAQFEAEEKASEKAKEGTDPAVASDTFAENTESGNDAPVDAAAAPVAAAAKPEEAPDIWANAPPDLKAAHDQQVKALETAQTEHARRSIEGRIASYQRRLKERAEAAGKPAAETPPEEEADPFAEVVAEYPEIGVPIQKDRARVAEKLSKFEAIEKSRQEAADLQMDTDLMANERLLEEKHPGWDKYLHDHGPAFGAWIVDQPLSLRQAFITNQEAIIDPYSAIDTISAFKSFVEANTQPPQPGATPPAAPQQRLNPRRAAQLAGSASPHTAGSRPTVSGIPQDGDEQAIWNAFRDIDPDEKKYRSA
jgi:hypothetical protein